MDWEDSSGSSGSDSELEDMWNVSKAVTNIRDTPNGSGSRGSMRGLQTAIAEGWLVQRARDMCSFAHDRYRQAAQAEAEHVPEGSTSKMSFRVCHGDRTHCSTLTTTHFQDNLNDVTRCNTRRLSNSRAC